MYRYLLLSLVIVLTAQAENSREMLIQHCIRNAGPDYPACTLMLYGQESRDLRLTAADEKKGVFASPTVTLSVPWKSLSDANICTLVEGFILTSPSAQKVAFLELLGNRYREHPLNHQLSSDLLRDNSTAYARLVEAREANQGKSISNSEKSGVRSSESKTASKGASESEPTAEESEGEVADGQEVAPIVSVLGKDGKPIRSVYIREATTYTGASISGRFGPNYTYFHKDVRKSDPFPEIWLRPDGGTRKSPSGYAAPYQVGDWIQEAGLYSSTVTQVMYLPTAKNDQGVDRVYIGANAHGSYWQKPFYWPPGGSHPEPAMKNSGYNALAGGVLDRPLAQARGFGTWCNASLMLFSNGMLAAGGSNTSQDRYPQFRFPPHKIPTAITLTSQNEFALVTIWDVKELKGQVAVLALESGYAENDGLMAIYSWHQSYPGLCNAGGFREIKLLGYLDLPGMYAPTAISAWNNARWWGSHLSTKENLADQAVRDKWRDGLEGKGPLQYQGGCTAGYAVVASRSEDKVIFIDLGPMFRYFAKMYFSGSENFAVTRNLGPNPDQWPFAFEEAPESTPKVSTPIRVKQPTAVGCSQFGSSGRWFGYQSGIGCRAYVACMDGTLRLYSVDALADVSRAAAQTPIALVGGIKVGRNPTCITYDRTKFSAGENSIWVVSRGDRVINRVQVTGNNASIDLSIRDQRLQDPVWAVVTDNHSNAGKILVVCDFEGKRITGYRYESVKLTTGIKVGMGPDGTDAVECTGSLDLPGYPISISASNVN